MESHSKMNQENPLRLVHWTFNGINISCNGGGGILCGLSFIHKVHDKVKFLVALKISDQSNFSNNFLYVFLN